jgi:hypothetical protein
MIRWFRKHRVETRTPPVASGDLTLQLLQTDWRCSCCGEMHHGLMDLAAKTPDPWPGENVFEPNSAIRLDEDFLSEDFCVIEGKHFFIRAILEIPVRGAVDPWAFGCWTTLSRVNFDRYVEGFDTGMYEDDGPWFGWLCNHLNGYFEGEPEAVDVYPQPNRKRPKLVVQNVDHPLARAQEEGITPEALFSLLRTYGHGPTVQ